MNDFALGGEMSSALWHVAAWGLAAIVEDATDEPVLTWWEDTAPSHPRLRSALSDTEVGEAVRAHTERIARTDSWARRTIASGPRQGTALFSPRVAAAATDDDRRAYAEQREDEYPDDALSDDLLIALGEPAWWRQGGKDGKSPDEGATRWEMKTRNKGQEFVEHRFLPIADAVAARDSSAIVTGLRGLEVKDEAGKDAEDSRSATGFTIPGPVDNAVAWCALWGIGAFALVPRSAKIAASAGVAPRHRTHPDRAALPVFTEPTPLGHVRAVLRSVQFDRGAGLQSAVTDGHVERVWLREQGVRAIAHFPIRTSSNRAAPERTLLHGSLDVL